MTQVNRNFLPSCMTPGPDPLWPKSEGMAHLQIAYHVFSDVWALFKSEAFYLMGLKAGFF